MRTETLDLLWQEPVKIGHWLGFNDLTELHNEWIKEYLFGNGDRTTQAHRGSYKTTAFSIAGALDIPISPKNNTIMLRKTDEDIKEIIKQISTITRTHLFKKIVYDIYGIELIHTKDSAFEIDTNLSGTNKGRPQILGLGIKTSITGKHADKVVTDDIVNLKDRISTAEREYTRSVYMELENVRNRGGRILNYGTPWHKNDAFTLMSNIQKYDCYSTGLISDKEIIYLKSKMTPSLFSANYELKHIADENAIFLEPKYTKERDLIFDGIGHIDAGYDGSDFTAFTIMKEREETRTIIDEEKLARTGDLQGSTTEEKHVRLITLGKIWDKHVDNCLNEIETLVRLYRCGTIHMEKNADKGYLKKEVVNRGLKGSLYSENMNKYIKIATWGKKYWDDVEFIEATDDEYVNQVMEYTETATHDDAPDSLASIIRELKARKVTANLYREGV